MKQTTRPTSHNYISAAWPQLSERMRTCIFLRIWLHLNPPPMIMFIPLFHFVLSIALLLILPHQPTSIIILLTFPLCMSIILSTLVITMKGTYKCPPFEKSH